MLADSSQLSTETLVPPPAISLAVDFYNRYSGEIVTYFVNFEAPNWPGATLQLSLPKVMQVVGSRISGSELAISPSIAETEQDLLVILKLQTPIESGQKYVLEVQARIDTFYFDQYLLAEVILLDADTQPVARESIQVAVQAKSAYLQYLPEIYRSDDFTSRFLMLIESFWKPISQQIDQVADYFNPDLTPEGFLPWLSSWVGLQVDLKLPEDRFRSLLRQGVQLFQYRGTLYALKTYLEIITTGQVLIREQRASNFILGCNSFLGVEIALGKNNQPHSISMQINIPEAELVRLGYAPEMYQRKIATIARTFVPAHIFFDIKCAFTKQTPPKEQA